MVLAAGMLSAAAGEALLTGVHPRGSYGDRASGRDAGRLRARASLVPATIVAVQGVPAGMSGIASGVLNTSSFVGAALGLAVLSTLAASHTHAALAGGTATARPDRRLLDPVRARGALLPRRRRGGGDYAASAFRGRGGSRAGAGLGGRRRRRREPAIWERGRPWLVAFRSRRIPGARSPGPAGREGIERGVLECPKLWLVIP